LSETLASKEEMEVLRVSLRYGSCFTVANQGHSGGLALLWEDGLQVSLLSFSTNHVDVSIDNWGPNQWRFTGFYGFPATSERHRTWELMCNLATQSALPWCMGGDFNCMMYRGEKSGGGRVPDYLLSGFRQAVFECGLVDKRMTGLRFTWYRGRTKERLDRFLVSSSWDELFRFGSGEVLPMASSDHAPIELVLCRHVQDRPQRRRFQFEDYWARKPACKEIVEKEWGGPADADPFGCLMNSISRCADGLSEWNSKENGGLTKRVRELQNRLVFLESLS